MTSPATLDDAALVARAARGDRDAFRALYRSYVRPVYWLAHGLVGPADADDVAQDTFVVAWRKLPQLTLTGDSLLPWLATVCRLQSANRLRARRREGAHIAGEADETLPAAVDVEEQVVSAQLAERIVDEVGRLSPLDQQIFRLCAIEGYGYDAASAELGVTHAAVRNRLSRIRTKLRATAEEGA